MRDTTQVVVGVLILGINYHVKSKDSATSRGAAHLCVVAVRRRRGPGATCRSDSNKAALFRSLRVRHALVG